MTTRAGPGRGQSSLSSAWRVLEQTGWLAECDVSYREMLCGIAELRHFEGGESVYRVGDSADGSYGFVEGAVDVGIPRIDGEMFVFHRSGPGLWVGDLALFSTKKRLASLQAVKRSVAVFLPRERLLELVDANPRITACFYRLSHENTAMLARLLGSLAITGAENWVALRLLMLAESEASTAEVVEISR